MKKWLLALLGMVALAGSAEAGQRIKEYTIFADGDTTYAIADTGAVVRSSLWFPVRGASAVYLRIRTEASDTDTATVDSITAVTLAFSDSLNPALTGYANQYAADSITVSVTGSVTSLPAKGIGASSQWINTPMTARKSGSGLYTIVYPSFATTSGTTEFGGGVIMPAFMKVQYTPKVRLTTAGFSSTAGKRTVGLFKPRIKAFVVYKD